MNADFYTGRKYAWRVSFIKDYTPISILYFFTYTNTAHNFFLCTQERASVQLFLIKAQCTSRTLIIIHLHHHKVYGLSLVCSARINSSMTFYVYMHLHATRQRVHRRYIILFGAIISPSMDFVISMLSYLYLERNFPNMHVRFYNGRY